ncbi:hypothetical protein DM02DRAFT_589186 [Periconia macrospinosa]|uniref:Uncharacterized protein n=1 Tax=Periconia macrospinosa TaxID=97972 RepID=A0A2V1DZN2_9PLEO|nr:hypothetical protein DM02DRAFT_589186 [Periconia macrospinosa]
MPQERIQNEGCSSVVSSHRQFDFNFTGDDAAANRWQLLDSSVPESRKSFRGHVSVDQGNPSQASDMEVRVFIASSDEEGLDNVQLHKSDSALNINYNLRNDSDVCTDVQIFVLLRPRPKRLLDWFDIRSSILDIDYGPQLGWEINNLVTHTSHGSLYMDSRKLWKDPLIAHNVSISSTDGVISGFFIPEENLELRNEEGGIRGFICPHVAEGVRFDPQNISISTVSGEINMDFLRVAWPVKVCTHRTKIESVSGDISAVIPHGVHTNISSISGTIKTAINPYGAASPNATSEIFTTSRSGDSWVMVHSPPNESLDGNYNPLLNTVSKHEVGEGELWLDYPLAWWGKMEGRIEHGKLEWSGSSLEDIKQGGGCVTAKRGEGESKIEAHVINGALTIRLGL